MSTARPSLRPADLHAASRAPLALAAQGFFWVGATPLDTPAGPVPRGQMYVEYWIPAVLAHPLPIVMIHGGGGQGLDFLGTADGREGWVHWFVRQGYAVYVVDRPGHGRAPFHPDALGAMTPLLPTAFLEEWFCRPEDFPERYPQARLHDKWPGSGRLGDPAFDHFLASAGPAQADMAQAHRDVQAAGAAMLDEIGPAILLTHSAGGPSGWLIADARPGLVKAIVAVEPVGPPFTERAGGKLVWGLTAAPLAFDPPAATPGDLRLEERAPAREGTVPCLVQQAPARRLPNLSGFPIAIVTAEASWMATDNHGVVDFLAQAGARVEHVRLEEQGVHGNGHAMMLETNSDEVARVIERWVAGQGLA
ncbi:alpha/beta hydrolase [Sphingomonas profundi]|uniref:alpha/beta hydrolase n=1 Tax=Alterirhizorhabdus profundi TaxID=2681549 RepID=UPI0012E9369C|nr:alpha/beta hydrolase [Sphingomonas profundi]